MTSSTKLPAPKCVSAFVAHLVSYGYSLEEIRQGFAQVLSPEGLPEGSTEIIPGEVEVIIRRKVMAIPPQFATKPPAQEEFDRQLREAKTKRYAPGTSGLSQETQLATKSQSQRLARKPAPTDLSLADLDL